MIVKETILSNIKVSNFEIQRRGGHMQCVYYLMYKTYIETAQFNSLLMHVLT